MAMPTMSAFVGHGRRIIPHPGGERALFADVVQAVGQGGAALGDVHNLRVAKAHAGKPRQGVDPDRSAGAQDEKARVFRLGPGEAQLVQAVGVGVFQIAGGFQGKLVHQGQVFAHAPFHQKAGRHAHDRVDDEAEGERDDAEGAQQHPEPQPEPGLIYR